MKKILKPQKTHLFNTTKIYKLKSSTDFPKLDYHEVPQYKIILTQIYSKYSHKCENDKIKPISLNMMKTKYGLPNNLNNYFIVNPNLKNAYTPSTIQIINAYKLIFILEMDLETANIFLESLHFQRLDSPMASNQGKLINYCLRCGYDFWKTNEFLIEHGVDGLL